MAITSLVRILGGVAMIVFAGTVVASATGAFFSDVEESTNNTFTAGALDLQIDNESYVTNNSGELVASTPNSWTLKDLDSGDLFFSFTDLKPGDIGEDTISLHPGTNSAWACMNVLTTDTPENDVLETEIGDETQDKGELQNYLDFTFWHDDGDNVFEEGELSFLSGTAADLFDGLWKTIADQGTGSPILGGQPTYVGKAWCFGTLEPNAVAQDGQGPKVDDPNTPEVDESKDPLVRGTGFTCNGSGESDDAQSDGIDVDVSFYAEQWRNNPSFQCSSLDVSSE